MASWPPDAEVRVELPALARCHRLCLPDTASSRAGLAVLEALYAGLLLDPAARVIWEPGGEGVPEQFHHIGIRIEDDAIVTPQGCELITRGVPVKADEIEALMRP